MNEQVSFHNEESAALATLSLRTTDTGRKVVVVRKGKLAGHERSNTSFVLLEVQADGTWKVIGEAATKPEADKLLQKNIWDGPNSPKV